MERQERYDEKLVQILESACGIFAEKGFHAASVRDVAAGTGVSPAGLYYYFKSKDELLFLILEDTLESLLARLRTEAKTVEDPTELLTSIIRIHLELHEAREAEMRVLAHEYKSLSGPLGQEVARLMKEYAGLVIRTLKKLAPNKHPQELRAAAFGLFGMLSWTDRWYRPGKDLPLERVADEFSRIFLLGFLAGEGVELPPPSEQDAAAGDKGDGRQSPAFSILSGPGF